MPEERKQHVRLEIAPIDPSTLKYRVTALIDDDIVHMATFKLDSDRDRHTFLRKVREKAEKLQVAVQMDSLEAEIMNLARDAAVGLIDNKCSGPSGGPIDHDEVLDAFGITVLGEHEDQSIRCWSANTRKTFTVSKPSNWKAEEVLQSVGKKSAARLWRGQRNEAPDGTFTLAEVQLAVALAAADAPRLTASTTVGQGVWPHDDGLLVVDGAQAWIYNGTAFKRLKRPTVGGKIIELDAAKQWHGELPTRVNEMNGDISRVLLRALTALSKSWNWKHSWDARVIIALVAATFIQAVWRWRPLVSITGASDSGKSTLMEGLLFRLFMSWGILADRSTEAGIRQAIGVDSEPVLIDEFDKYRHRRQLLELFRTSSRGGKVLRGTVDQKGQQFGLHHIPFFAATESGDLSGPDRNRFIHLELNPPGDRKYVPDGADTLRDLGKTLSAAAIWAAPAAVRLADTIKGIPIEDVPGRLIESFSVPAAMFAVLRYGREATTKQAEIVLRLMIRGRQVLQERSQADERQLLDDILAANIRVTMKQGSENVSKEQSVGQLILNYNCFKSELEAKGVRVLQSKKGVEELFFAPHPIRRYLLAGTRWSESRLDQILLRFTGARHCQARSNGSKPWGVAIPLSVCLGGLTAEDTE